MKCVHCYSDLVEGAKFCDSCGAPVAETPQQPPAVPYTANYLGEEPAAAPQPPVVSYPPAPQNPVNDPFQSPFGSAQANAGSVPPAPYGVPPAARQSGEKILGIPAENMGTVALGLGGAGCLLSFIGCGGLISLLGLIAGFLSLKTEGRKNGTIGLVLSGLGLIVALAMTCVLLFAYIGSQGSGYSGY
jgi:hypothetical protein